MKFRGNGLLLFVNNYESCVDFYKNKLMLPVIFSEGDILTTFDFGGSYLMIEPYSILNSKDPKTNNSTALRFDVDYGQFNSCVKQLKENHIELQEQTFDWGQAATFSDPDGTICQLYAPLKDMPDNFTKR